MRFVEGDETLRFGFPVGPSTARVVDGPSTSSASSASSATLRESLLRVVGESALTPQCFVEFSGGCDSSLVLSAAATVRRQAGLPDPVPVTYRYSGRESEEVAYQDAVISWLGLQSWKVIEIGDDADFLGPPALASLRRTGLIWPATLHYKAGVFTNLPSGSAVLNGEGGDEVFGSRRVSPSLFVARLIRHRIRPSRRALGMVGGSFLPSFVRFRKMVTRINENYWPLWLVPDMRQSLIARAAQWESAEPLAPSAWPAFYLALPRTWILLENMATFGQLNGVNVRSPMLTPSFMANSARLISWRSYGDRSAILNRHFADLLPEAILNRTTKATFGSSYFGPYTRAFAERWDGTGLPEGIDGQWLKHHWMTADVCHAGTSMLLHAAWLATEGADVQV